MRKLLRKAAAFLLCLPVLAGMTAAAEASPVREVSAQTIAARGFSAAVQDALDAARRDAAADAPVTVRVAPGSYRLEYGLHIYDNTTLDLSGVTVVRGGLGNMLRVGDEDTVDTGATGYRYQNITLRGGVLDGGAGYNTMIKVAHAAGFTMEDMTLCNEHNGHMMEVAGVDGFTARRCAFRDQLLDVGGVGYEAIQFDILHPDHMVNCRAEDLNMRDILVEDCVFENVPRGIGTHTGVLNNPFDGVIIRRNVFRDIKSAAIQGVNWKNVRITGNRIEQAARGISVYAVMYGGSGMYRADTLAKMGGTEAHVSCAYQPPQTKDIEIADNTLRGIGTVDDIYASYVSQGVAVIGDTLTGEDAENGLPAGEYDNQDVFVHDNDIETCGHGVRLEETDRARVSGNLIRCAPNTVHPANYYGIVLTANARTDELARNVITNAAVNGIQLANSPVKSLTRNCVEHTGKYGVAAYGCRLGEVTENDVSHTPRQGVVLLDGSSVESLRCNRVSDCGMEAYYFTRDCAAADVRANTAVRSQGGVAYTKSAGMVAVGANHFEDAALTSLALDGAGVRLGVGTSYLLAPDVRPVNSFARLTFTSEDESVAHADGYGRITAVGVGETTVAVRSENGVTARFAVEVGEEETAALIPADRLTAPKITMLQCVSGGIRIDWEPVDGAHGYRLYYRYGDGAWKRMKDVSALSYTDPGVSFGRAETYTIRALGADGEPLSGYDPVGWSKTYQLGAPEITSLQNRADGICLRWRAVKGVTRYRVFFKNSGGGWTGLATVSDTSFVDRKVKSGRAETYTVRGLDKNGAYITDYDHLGATRVYVGVPRISETQSVADGIRLSWQPVAGASGYRVYYKNTKGGWTAMADTAEPVFVDTDVRSGRTYTYTLRCLDANGDPCSAYDAAGWKAGFVAVPQPQLQRAGAGVRVSWQAVSGAYAYRVFYQNSEGGWTALGTTASTYFYDKAVRKGVRYTYTVRCIDQKGNYVSDYLHSGKSIVY